MRSPSEKQFPISPHTDKLDVAITQWKQAVLEKPSVVRLTRLETAEKVLLKTKIGQLAVSDLETVRRPWNQRMRL
jgi:hypothetical protein